MDLSQKGFVDERDNHRFIFKQSNLQKSNTPSAPANFTLMFDCFNAETMEWKFDYIVNKNVDFYKQWTDLRDAYLALQADLGISVELPESMDEELFN